MKLILFNTNFPQHIFSPWYIYFLPRLTPRSAARLPWNFEPRSFAEGSKWSGNRVGCSVLLGAFFVLLNIYFTLFSNFIYFSSSFFNINALFNHYYTYHSQSLANFSSPYIYSIIIIDQPFLIDYYWFLSNYRPTSSLRLY